MGCTTSGQCGSELGWNGMVNIRERLINVVISQQAKGADRLGPKGMQHGRRATHTPVVASTLPANRADLPHSGTEVEHGKSVALPSGKASRKTSRRCCRYRRREQAKASL